jgi:RimJ/RimL family protein N-acetyltransferase
LTFMHGIQCQLRVLQGNDYEVRRWTDGVMSGLTTEHLFTGSFPMRMIDIKEVWEKERKAGDVLFGIWYPMNGTDQWEFIGTCGLHSHREIYRSWEARFLIFEANLVGKGIGKEAVDLLTRYAFSRLNAHRVWLGVSADNLRAYKCYLDAGYKVEGTLRDELFYGGEYHDAIRMSVLETDK